MIRDLKIINTTLRYNYRMRRKDSVRKSAPDAFYSVLDQFAGDHPVFVHVGLSQIRQAFEGDPYYFMMDALSPRFSAIITTAFTPSFRTTGLYHKTYSKPEFGTFNARFLDDATFRTDDPIHSLLVKGDYIFKNPYTPEAFGEGSCFDQLDQDNVLCLSIATRWPVSSQKHYIEYRFQLPYVRKARYKGIIYYNEKDHEPIETVNYVRNHWFNKYITLMWNNYKIARQMKDSGLMRVNKVGGIYIYAFRLGDLRVFLQDQLKKDPYYLFT